MSTNSPDSPVPGERIVLRLIVEAVPNADAVGVRVPPFGTLLDEDLAVAVQAAEDAFVAALRGTRDVVSTQHRLFVAPEVDVPNPSTDPEF